MSTDERRAPGATRIPFEALVEVGAALGPSFEAQAIDISEEGMHLRTAYLPEVGQPLSCRFEAGASGGVVTSGEVVWKQEAGKGGEFGIRFTDVDAQSAEALRTMMGVGRAPAPAKGNRVRLHIEGLASPMRAHVKRAGKGGLTAFSGLGFLQVGKQLQLEDAATGTKRPAHVTRVECEIDPESRVPQLVMSFQFEDEEADEAEAAGAAPAESTPEPMVTHEEPRAVEAPAKSVIEDESISRAEGEMKGFVARSAAKVTPALERLLDRAKTTVAVLAAKRRGGTGDDVAIPLRRRTSPPPLGGLHASGRKVVRDSLPNANAKEIPPDPAPKTKRIGLGLGVVAVLAVGAFVLHKSAPPPAATTADATTAPAAAPLTPTTAEAPLSAPPSVLSPTSTTLSAPSVSNPASGMPTEVASDDALDDAPDTSHAHHASKLHVAPFSNGAVSHGNVLRIKMDGAIEKIEGDAQPAGFTVVLPGRRSLEPAAPLAARDGRIASIRVANDGTGAELTVAFKDGVPNYLVRAKGDVLEIVLAPTGSVAPAVKPARATTAPALSRHHHHNPPR